MRVTARTMGTVGLGLLAACVGEEGRGPGSNITGIGGVSMGSQEGTEGTSEGASEGDEPTGGTGTAESGGSAADDSNDDPKFDLGATPDGGGPPPSWAQWTSNTSSGLSAGRRLSTSTIRRRAPLGVGASGVASTTISRATRCLPPA